MAHKKAASSTDNGRDSISKRLGVKLFGGQTAKAGNIIIRQRGTRFHAGLNTYLGKDFTVHAKVDGIVSFRKRKYNRTFVDITPFDAVQETVAKVKPKKKAAPKAAPKAKVEAPAPIALADTSAADAAADAAAKAAADKAAADAAAKAAADKAAADAAAKAAADKAAADAAAKAAADKAAADAAKAAAATSAAAGAVALPKGVKQDDLKIIEGVGPKIAGLLAEGGLDTWAKVAASTPEAIKEILIAAGPRYQMHNPGSWPKQAGLAAAGKFDELNALQDELDGGK